MVWRRDFGWDWSRTTLPKAYGGASREAKKSFVEKEGSCIKIDEDGRAGRFGIEREFCGGLSAQSMSNVENKQYRNYVRLNDDAHLRARK